MLGSLPGGQRACLCSHGRDRLCPLSKSPCPRGPRGAARVSCSLSPAASSYSGTQAPTMKDRRRSADKAFGAESRVCHRELGRLSQVAEMEAKREGGRSRGSWAAEPRFGPRESGEQHTRPSNSPRGPAPGAVSAGRFSRVPCSYARPRREPPESPRTPETSSSCHLGFSKPVPLPWAWGQWLRVPRPTQVAGGPLTSESSTTDSSPAALPDPFLLNSRCPELFRQNAWAAWLRASCWPPFTSV